ncbi:outer membrane protein [Neisseria gonorrhoeae]|nr:outer membrane protein [Neisseria gonorrhoeae]
MRRAEARPATLSMHPLASPTLRNILRTHPVKNTRTVPIHRNPKTRHSRADAHHQSNSIRRVGLGVIAGVGFDITPNLTLDAGYRYHNWGRLENTRFKTHEASLGVRYRF